MRRRKKLIVAAVLAGVLLFGSLGGIALADNGDDNGPAARFGEFIDKVCAIYADKSGGDTIDNPEALREALTEARTQMREEAMGNRLQGLTDEQKEALKEWWGGRPEDLPMKFGGRMHGGFSRGMCRPPTSAE